jgi:hypothetical protein
MNIFEEAKDLLEKRGLRKILEKYGSVQPTGSFVLDLMTWRDLDLYLVSESINSDEFLKLGFEINKLLNPVKMSFRNELIAKTEGLPNGLYWGVYLGNERDRAWKIDIWNISKEEAAKRHRFCEELEKKLDHQKRKVIHELKGMCWKNQNYRKSFYSTDIYEAVLDNGIVTFVELREFINSKYKKQLIC